MKMKSVATGVLGLFLTAQMAFAEGLSNRDMAFAFGKDQTVTHAKPVAAPKALSGAEMEATEGEALPLFALGALHAGRWVTTRYVSRTVAANAARAGCNVMCTGTSAQARSLATQAYGRGNVLRHGPSGHVRSPVNYSHYQSLSGSPRGHIFYGSRLR